jgi:hypothetical protein
MDHESSKHGQGQIKLFSTFMLGVEVMEVENKNGFQPLSSTLNIQTKNKLFYPQPWSKLQVLCLEVPTMAEGIKHCY